MNKMPPNIHTYTHTCSLCIKTFNSEEQWKAHVGGKKHKYILGIASKDKIHGKKQIAFNMDNNSINHDIQKLRALGISIPRAVNKVIKCKKLSSPGSKYDISKMTELSESYVLMEGETILRIYVDSFFPSQKCQECYDLLNFTYDHGGNVERRKEKTGGDMVMLGWRLDTFIEKPTM